MTNNLAESLLKEIIITLDSETKKHSIPDEIQDAILEKCIDITVDQYDEKSIMILNKNPKSIKFANISIDLKQAFEIAMEFLLTASIPADKLNAAKMILLVVLKAWQLSTKSISDEMAYIVLMLNELNAYQCEISIDDLRHYFKQNTLLSESDLIENFDAVLDKLYEYKIIDMDDGKVRLKEKILYAK